MPRGRAEGAKDKIAFLDDREGKLQDFTNHRGTNSMGGVTEGHLMVRNISECKDKYVILRNPTIS